MTTPEYARNFDRAYLAWEKCRHESLRPVVPLPAQLAARQHEYELAEGRRKRSERAVNLLIGAWAAIGAVALALGIWWGAVR